MKPREGNPLRPLLTSEEIDQLRPFGVEQSYSDGDVIFRERVHSDTFFVILSGQVKVSRSVAGEDLLLAFHQPGGFTGEISVINGEESLVTGAAVGELRVLHIPSARFHDVILACPELMTLILPILAKRGPAILGMQTEREKLAALGKLAAGFAHELNNPASAAARGAATLLGTLRGAVKASFGLLRLDLTPDQINAMQELIAELSTRRPSNINPLERSDIEETLALRLTALEVPDPWSMAACLADAGIRIDDVDRMADLFSPEVFASVLDWVGSMAETFSMVHDVQNATVRISDLVQSIKSYSYVDQAAVQEVDVHVGLDDTLRMLDPALRQKSITVVKNFDPGIPTITAYGGELNQVWTNLIDNAISAMDEGGRLEIRTMIEGDLVRVDIQDNGTGIAPEVLPRIFEPFFTTKREGHGTGLGLDITYKIVFEHHKGDLHIVSQPGKTIFHVRLPLALKGK